MAEIDRNELSALLERIVPEIAGAQITTGPHSLQCIGAEISSGSHFHKHTELTNARLSASVKPSLERLARRLRSRSSAAATLAATGRLALSLREAEQPTSEDYAFARHFYAHDVTVDLQADSNLPPFRLQTWGFTSQKPSTPYSPLALRVAIDRLASAIRATYGSPSRATFAAAMRGGALKEGLGVLAILHDLNALALWQYDEITRRFRTIATWNTGQMPLTVPLGPPQEDERRGIVSQLAPERRPVVYDVEDRTLWSPAVQGNWRPFDDNLFAAQGWRSCIAVPVVCAGRLVGALAAYSASSAAQFKDIESQLASAAALCADAILVQREQSVIATLTTRYDEELLAANVSLSALSLSHDILHYYSTVTSHVTDVKGYIETGQHAEALKALDKISKTMASTEPSIAAMIKLATAARTSRREAQLIEDVTVPMQELQVLLRSILPHAAKPTRVDPKKVIVQPIGTIRPIAVSLMTLERIVVNLCVNSAQWNASEITVTGRFDRRADFELVVRDDGLGIPESQRDSIFDRFYSGRNGSGLGLYVVKSLVSRAGGEVYVQSYDYADAEDEELQGTIITVFLPTVKKP